MTLTPSSLVKSEPVLVAHGVAWLFLQAGLILVGRYHVLSSSNWSALASTLAPVVTAAAMALLALVIRHVVTPALDWVQHEAGPIVGDVEKAIADAQAIYPMPPASVTTTSNPAVAVPPAAPTA